MELYYYEIYLRDLDLSSTSWQSFFDSLMECLGNFSKWQIIVHRDRRTIHYYIASRHVLPVGLGAGDFFLQSISAPPQITSRRSHSLEYNLRFLNLGMMIEKLKSAQCEFSHLVVSCHSLNRKIFSRASIYFYSHENLIAKTLTCYQLSQLLSINFSSHPDLLFKKFPKYLKSEKTLRYSRPDSDDALLSLDTFPYLSQDRYLNIADYNFNRHSLILGSSGVGKSKFIALFIDRVYRQSACQAKIIVIDPHDALRHDLVDIQDQQVFDFSDAVHSIDLFAADVEHLGAYVELMLTLFRSLLGEVYNGRLERVLRHSITLLTIISDFSFVTLRQLLLEASYRNKILNEHRDEIPSHVAHFFLADFSEIRTQAYDLAIAPLIAFIDEMQMVPVFSEPQIEQKFTSSVQSNFLTIFSLSRAHLGEKVTRTIAGLLMQQIFLIAESQTLFTELIVIIDEVAVIENPILARFLSELRKYHVSVILAGQYLGQLSPDLRDSIFTNVQNYYLFRVSKSDANLLVRNLNMKLVHDDTIEHREELLTGLRARECLVRLSHGDELLPATQARTMDFTTSN